MDLDLLFHGDSLLNKELGNSLSMLSLQLDNLSPLVVTDDGTITVPLFLEVAHQFLEVEVIWETLDNSNALSGCTLLELNMNHTLLSFSLTGGFTIWSSDSIESVLDLVGTHNLIFIFDV